MIRTKAQSQEGIRSDLNIGNLPFLHWNHPISSQGWDLGLIQVCRKFQGHLQRIGAKSILHLSQESQKCWKSLNSLGLWPKQHKHQGSSQLIVYQEIIRSKAPRSLGTHSPRWRMTPRPSFPSQKNLNSMRMLTWSSQPERSPRKFQPRNLLL